MKRVRRIWCLLLALVMIAGMIPSFAVPAQAATAYTFDTHLNYTESADGSYAGIPSGVNVVYLSGNADNGSAANPNTGYADGTADGNVDYPGVSEIYWVKYNKVPARSGVARTPTVGVNFGGDVVLANKTRISHKSGVTTTSGSYNSSQIILGAKDTVFTRGIGLLPNGKGSTSNFAALTSVIYDLQDGAGNAAYDYFYSVVGFTGTAKTDNTGKTMDFIVYGSKTGGITDPADSSFELLASSGSLGKKSSKVGAGLESGEIHVSVAGYKTLMLVVNPEAGNASRGAAWGNACVYQLPRTEASVSVDWTDNNDADGKRPEAIEVELLKDGVETGQKLTLNAANSWAGTIGGLRTGSTYTYKVLTANSENYNFSYAGGKVTAEYLFVSQAASISWSDSNNQYGKRPDAVAVQLYAGGTAVDGKTLTLNAAGSWAGSFTGLPKYDASNNPIVYSIDTDAVNYYDKAVSGSIITLTCNYDPTLVTTDYTVTATWDGDTGHEDERSAVVQLYADGVKVDDKTVTLNKDKSSHTFEGIKKFKDGTETDIVYSVKVEDSKFYNFAVSGGDITATYIPMQTVEIPVEIVFVDNDNALNLRPSEVKVKLWADGAAVDGSEVTLNEGNAWKTSWTKDKWTADRTKDVEYKVTLAEPIPQYTTEEDAYANGKLTVKRSAKTDVVAAVAWSHGENTSQPAEISVSLYANNVWQETQKLSAANLDTESGKWTYKWEAKPLWDDTKDEAITYTLSVGDVADYTVSVDQATGNITATYQKAEGVKFATIGSKFNEQYAGLASDIADKAYFLTDLSNGANSQIVSGTGAGYKFFENYDGKLSVWNGTNATDSQSRTEEASTAIKLGYNGKAFSDGISGMANTANQDASYITYDLTGMTVDRFYALAGITGTGNNNSSGPNVTNTPPYVLLNFEVWGSTDGATYKRLAYAEKVRAYLVAEFDVDITGYTYLKLVVRNTGTTNEGAAFSWADACVYSSASGGTVTPPSTPATMDIPVAVAWIGDNSETANRPDVLQVQLMKGDNTTGKTLDLNAAGSWEGKFTGLEVSDDYSVSVLTPDTEYYDFSCVNNTVIADYIYTGTGSGGTGGGTGGEETIPGKYTASTDGTYAGIKAAENSVVYLSEASASDATKGKYITKAYVAPKAGSTTARYPTLDYPFSQSAGKAFLIGSQSASFQKGLGVLPVANNPDGTLSTHKTFVMVDISNIADVDRFYAVAGITGSAKDKTTGAELSVAFEVYGSPDVVTDENDASFKKLAVSGDMAKADSGEFDVDITGYKTLKLVTLVAEDNTNGLNSNCQSAWANACVYKYDATGSNPGGEGGGTGGGEGGGEGGSTDPLQPNAYTASSNNGIKAAADSVIYLSERDTSDNTKGKYISGYYNIPATSGDTTTIRYPALDGAFPTSGSAIKIGSGTTEKQYLKGLGVLPSSARETTQNYTLIDLSGIANADRFYAMAGMTGSGKNSSGAQFGVVFEVWGSDQVTTDANDASFKKLTVSTDIFKADSGEFNVDITGYKTLKLVTVTAAGNSGGFNSGCQSVWANACVYKYDANGTNPLPTVPDDSGEETLPGVYTPSSNGSYAWISGVKGGVVKYLSQMNYTASVNSSSTNNTTYNYPYGGKTTEKIIIGAKNTGFTYGLGVHPKSGTAAAYTTYDLTGLDVDRFYAAVGITNSNGKKGTDSTGKALASDGVRFEVYADFDGNGLYKKLAESDKVSLKHSGEFHVDITGAKSLKLVVFSANGNNASCGSAWANACVYKYDPNGSTPSSNSVVGASNTSSTTKKTTTTAATDNTGLEHIDGFIPSEDGEYTGIAKEYLRTLTWLSNLTYKEASNSTNSANPDGQPTTLDHPYNALTDMLIIGEGDRAFFKGLGVHPKDPTKPVNDTIESWTIYDLSKMNVDRFYSAVGLTNEKGKEGASKGVIFKVYADYGDGEFKLLSHSGCISGRESGEFDLDISGVKLLKLAVVSASTSHASSASGWGNACVYNSADKYEGVGLPEIHEPTAKPTEPKQEEVTPEATEPVEAPAEEAAPTSTGVIIALVGMGLLILILLILLLLKKKPGKA